MAEICFAVQLGLLIHQLGVHADLACAWRRARTMPGVCRGSWTAWKANALWLTPYFSLGVWLSIAMVWVPGR